MTLNRPNPRLQILRAQLAAEADAVRMQRASYKISNAIGCSCPVPAPDADSLPLPPDYWSDLEHWLKTLAPAKPDAKQRESHAPVTIGFDLGAPEGDTTVIALAPAKPAAPEAPFPAPPQLPPVPGLALADIHAYIRDRLASTSSADGAALIGERPAEPRTIPVPWDQWHEKAMRDMVKPAQQPAQKASTHSVCIRSHGVWKAGEVTRWHSAKPGTPDNWLPCDESGWVTHVPTADAVCPVPRGVLFSVRMRDGQESAPGTSAWSWGPACDGTIIAWRPIAQS